jgi:hypothetical protein
LSLALVWVSASTSFTRPEPSVPRA